MFKQMSFAILTMIVTEPLAAPSAAAQAAPVPADPTVSAPREVLERYVGRYELNGAVVTVSLTEDGRLIAQLSGQPPAPPLRTVSASEFVNDAMGVHLFFEGEGPQATRIRSQFGGTEVVGIRIPEGTDAAAAVALGARAAPAPLDAAARQEVVSSLASALRERYVFPEIGVRTAARIDANLAAGEYDSLRDPVTFAARLSADANSIANDRHLQVNSMSTPPLPPPGAGAPLPGSESGVVRADRLSGGIGYIEVVAFPRPAGLKPVIDPVMRNLADSTALIIDLRRNIGGLPEGVAYLVSFLVPPGQSVHLDDVVTRVPGTNEVTRQPFFTEPTSVSFAGRPIYVLTSNRTFSAGEAFAYDVQSFGLGTLVGELTGGGGNLIGPVRLGHGLIASIPLARAENAVTRTNWEGRGVEPDFAVPADEALAVVLQRLGQPAVTDIAAASQQQLFAPRTVPLPGTEAALRAVVSGVLQEPADLGAFASQPAEMLRPQVPELRQQLASLGEIRSIRFHGPGLPAGDAFEVIFANGALEMNIILAPDGLVLGFSMRQGG